ncbi:MAG: lysophospholipid acyltransferase family protein [Candidatus Fermentibacteraceae bacterium]
MARKRLPFRRLRHAVAMPLMRLAVWGAVVCPRRVLWWLAGLLGWAAAGLPIRSNRIIARHRRTVMAPQGITARSSDIYRYVLAGILDFIHLSYRSDDAFGKVVRMEGAEHLDRALEAGKGAIVITAHYGGWELMPRAVVLQGHRTAVVGRRLWQPGPADLLNRLRERPGVHTLRRKGGVMSIVRQLRKNTAIGILIDQDTSHVQGDFVEFLGRPAMTPVGPAGIALRMGVPVVPLHIRRRRDSTYLITVEEPVDTSGFAGEEGALELTQLLTRRIEAWVREDPRQWIWFHRRWRRSPKQDRGS